MGDLSADWMLDTKMVRFVFAAIATVLCIATLLVRTGDALDWSILSVTVVVFWAWAFSDLFAIPMYVLGIGGPIALNLVESDMELSMFLVVATVAILTSMQPQRALVAATVVALAVVVFVLGITDAINRFSWPNWLFGIGFSAGFGALMYRFVSVIEELKHARALVADQAAVHERRRIARDVHDLVGHSLSVVMLHITGARHLVRKDPDEAERALEQAEAAGRESLAEIRRTVGMLRDDDDGQAIAMPSPDLGDVSGLVDEYLLAGLDISYDTDGVLASVEGAAALAGYRIIQEALTNVTRHTIETRVLVAISVEETSYELSVRNSGGTVIDLKPGAGFGLTSMRERAKSVGGLLVAGPTPDGWVVEATLPVHSAELTR